MPVDQELLDRVDGRGRVLCLEHDVPGLDSHVACDHARLSPLLTASHRGSPLHWARLGTGTDPYADARQRR